jgi:hypothetical protein
MNIDQVSSASRTPGQVMGRVFLRAPIAFFLLCLWATLPAAFAQDLYSDSWGTDQDGEYGQYASVDGSGVTDNGYGGGTYWIETSFYTSSGGVIYDQSYGNYTGAVSFVSDVVNVDSATEGNFDIYSEHYYTPDNTITGIEHVGSSSFLGLLNTFSQSYQYVGQCTFSQGRYNAWCYSSRCSMPSGKCLPFTTPYAVVRGIRISIRIPFLSIKSCIGKYSGSTWLPPCV